MTKSKYKSKYFISLVFCIIALFILSILLVLFAKDKFIHEETVNQENISVIGNDEVLTLNNRLPVSDDFGRTIKDDNNGSFIYLEFSIKNNTDDKQKYQVYLTKTFNDEGNVVREGYVKVYVTSQDDVAFPIFSKNFVPSYADLYYVKDKADSKSVLEDTLEAKEEKKFRVRAWIADNYVVSDNVETFSFEVGARAI